MYSQLLQCSELLVGSAGVWLVYHWTDFMLFFQNSDYIPFIFCCVF